MKKRYPQKNTTLTVMTVVALLLSTIAFISALIGD